MHDTLAAAMGWLAGGLAGGLAGLALGGVFFGGLCWTVRRMLSSGHPAWWLAGSGLLRMAVVLPGFYAVGAGHWDRLVACLAGFLMARWLVTRIMVTRDRRRETATRAPKEARRAAQS